eukprot:4440085-Amphidinium_carterae.1
MTTFIQHDQCERNCTCFNFSRTFTWWTPPFKDIPILAVAITQSHAASKFGKQASKRCRMKPPRNT